MPCTSVCASLLWPFVRVLDFYPKKHHIILQVEGVQDGSPAQLCGSENPTFLPRREHLTFISTFLISIFFSPFDDVFPFFCLVPEIGKGDAVTAVNGIATGARYGLTLEQVKPLIVGNPGTTVRIPEPIPRGKTNLHHVLLARSDSALASMIFLRKAKNQMLLSMSQRNLRYYIHVCMYIQTYMYIYTYVYTTH